MWSFKLSDFPLNLTSIFVGWVGLQLILLMQLLLLIYLELTVGLHMQIEGITLVECELGSVVGVPGWSCQDVLKCMAPLATGLIKLQIGLRPAITFVYCSAYSTLKFEAICCSETSVDFIGRHGILSQKIVLYLTNFVLCLKARICMHSETYSRF